MGTVSSSKMNSLYLERINLFPNSNICTTFVPLLFTPMCLAKVHFIDFQLDSNETVIAVFYELQIMSHQHVKSANNTMLGSEKI